MTTLTPEVREELAEALGNNERQLGVVYSLMAAGATTNKELVEGGATGGPGAAANLRVAVRAVLDEKLPTGPTVALMAGRSVGGVLRDNPDLSDAALVATCLTCGGGWMRLRLTLLPLNMRTRRWSRPPKCWRSPWSSCLGCTCTRFPPTTGRFNALTQTATSSRSARATVLLAFGLVSRCGQRACRRTLGLLGCTAIPLGCPKTWKASSIVCWKQPVTPRAAAQTGTGVVHHQSGVLGRYRWGVGLRD